MKIISDYIDYLHEGYLFDDKTISIDLDKFESGESNVLLITGSPGSGKTTLSHYLENKYKCEVIHLDDYISQSKDLKIWLKKNNFPETIEEIRKISRQQAHIIIQRMFDEVAGVIILKLFKQGIKVRCIVEGAVIAQIFDDLKQYILKEKMPMIIIGKSGLKSSIGVERRSKIKHPEKTILQSFDVFWRHFKSNMTRWVKGVNNTRRERCKVPGSNIQEYKIPKL